MLKSLTFTQKMIMAFSLPLIILLINSLMAYMQIRNYQRMMEHEIIQIQDSNHIKSDLEKLIETSDRIARTAGMSLITVSMISIFMVVLLSFIVVRSFQIQNQNDRDDRVL